MKKRKLQIQVNAIEAPENFVKYAVQIGNLFTYYCPEVLTKNTKKLLIEFHVESNVLLVIPEKDNEEIYTIQDTFPFEEFISISAEEKSQLLLKRVYQCLLILFSKLFGNTQDLAVTYKKILENNFKLELELAGGMKLTKNKRFKASVIANHLLGYALISVRFFKEDNVFILEKQLFKTVPSFFVYSQLIGMSKWMNNEVFQISNPTKEIIINIDIIGDIIIDYKPNNRTITNLKDIIKYLTIERLIDI